MGSAVEHGASLAILTNNNPRHEDPRTIFRDVLEGFCNRAAVEVIPDRVKAVHRALAAAQPGDCVLIAGKGHETCQIVGDRRLLLDDREVAREWLYHQSPIPSP
jgi:UDP-N-acetylmuramoyl-L-alanyl-D-glutamate--2,6-diaminopimelate ligase